MQTRQDHQPPAPIQPVRGIEMLETDQCVRHPDSNRGGAVGVNNGSLILNYAANPGLGPDPGRSRRQRVNSSGL